MGKLSPVDSPVVSDKPADRLVAEALPDGTVVDHRTGTVMVPKKSFPRRMDEGRRLAAKDRATDDDPVHAPERGEKPAFVWRTAKQNDRPPRPRIVDPRSHDTAHVVVPKQVMNRIADKAGVSRADVEVRIEEERIAMNVRARVRFACARITEKAPVWVLISMVWRSGERTLARELALAQFNEEALTHTGKATCVKWARKLRVDVVQPLESGDFQKADEIAYHLLQLASKRGRNTKEMEAEFAACRLNPTPATHDIVPEEEEDLPPMADDVMVAPPSPKLVASPAIVTEAPVAEEEIDSLEDAPTEEVPLPVAVNSPPVPVPEAPVAKKTENPPEPPPAPESQPKPSPAPTQVVDEVTVKAAALATTTVEEFLTKSPRVQKHFVQLAKQEAIVKPTAKPAVAASLRKDGRVTGTLADLKLASGTK